MKTLGSRIEYLMKNNGIKGPELSKKTGVKELEWQIQFGINGIIVTGF